MVEVKTGTELVKVVLKVPEVEVNTSALNNVETVVKVESCSLELAAALWAPEMETAVEVESCSPEATVLAASWVPELGSLWFGI